ncbi:alpha/beta fold hydrolase [Streptomyces sp. NPDC044571]|uniref:alpha/beta hydrolase family protein n=1 Tax=Streptomyces sp. NPDC044571 TaxID=3155371 RepID=UPI0033CDD4E2
MTALAIANAMKGEDDGAFHDAWYATATRYITRAKEAERRGKKDTARYHYLRATVYAGVSHRPLYGKPVGPRLVKAFNTHLVDGPGQGAPLIDDGLTLIPDWERVTRPVVDAVAARPDVDPDRIVLQGWSLGGYLALRAASGEPRLAAVVADPPVWSMLSNLPLARLKAPTTLQTFTAADGAGDHQEQQNRALAETVILDWIDDTLS